MLNRILLAFFVIISPVTFVHAEGEVWNTVKSVLGLEEEPESATIKVLVSPLIDGALLEVKGAYNIYNPMSGDRLGTRFFGKNRFIQPRDGGLKWGEYFPGVFQVAFVPDDPQTTVLVNGIEYKGTIYVYQIGHNKISVVNEVDIEDYVKSVLALEFDAALSSEAMAAVAIAARTDAYFQREKNLKRFWHITAANAGYKGFAVTHRPNGVDAAVDSTRYLVLNDLVSRGSFPAKWTRHSGGKTAPYRSLFRLDEPGPQESVEAPYAMMNREETTWTCTVSRQELAAMVKLQNLSDLMVYRESESGRVYGLRLQDGRESRNIAFIDLQNYLGAKRLKSSDFTTRLDEGEIIFLGKGEGHGVGLCLYSAEVMSEKGDQASKILNTFFPMTQLRMADKVLPSTAMVAQEVGVSSEAMEGSR